MNTDIKTKLLLLTLTTLLVLGGGYMYYDRLFERSTASNLVMEQTFIIPDQDIVPLIGKSGNGNNLPKYKSSKHGNIKEANGFLVDINETDIAGIGSVSAKNPHRNPNTSANLAMAKTSSNNQIFTTQALMAAGNYSYGKRGTGVSSSSYSSSVSAIPAPQLANGASFDTNHGLGTGDELNDVSDDFLPPEGAPISEGLFVLLLLAGIYLIPLRKK